MCLTSYAYQQTTDDTLFVNGANLEHMSRYITYYVDTTHQKTISEIAGEKSNFKKWETDKNLNLGLNPYPLWLHLNVSNRGNYSRRYWLSLYTQADSIYVFQKVGDEYLCTDTLSYNIAQQERKVDARFLVAPVRLDSNESKEFYVKIISLTKTQNFIVDFTTPESNLLWERDFAWLVLFFTGCFSLVALISFLLSFAIRQKIFLYYGIYIFSIVLLVLSQELMLSVFPPKLFSFFNGIHPMSLAIIGLYIHYLVILYITEHQKNKKKMISIFKKVNQCFFYYGIITMISYFIFQNVALTQLSFYHFLYSLSIGIILVQLAITFLTIVFAGNGIKRKISYTIAAALLIYFNPAGYYLNYSGIIHYYEITYPNYFYWFLCIEFILLGYFISWKYRKMVKEKEVLTKENELLEQQSYLIELEAQERKQNQIARDLHDDLGATLSALKLIITNNYKNDTYLVNMISKANTDLRYFFNRLSSSGLKEKGLFKMLEEKKHELNQSGNIYFSSIFVGDDKNLPDKLLLTVYRIANELLLNILKHSNASEASVQLIIDEEHIELITEDNGKGYDTNQKNQGMGLDNIHVRTNQLNGQIHISSSTSGTTTIITIPK